MSVVIYLMRHGIAADATQGTRDADRALTAEGVRKTNRVAVGLRTLGVAPDLILASPLRRAEETARVVAEVLAPSLTVELYPPLAIGARPEDVIRGVRPARRAGEILLVGHEPDMGQLASYLLSGSASLIAIPFKKAGVAAITVASVPSRSAGLLDWFLTPSQLRAIADSHN